MGHELEKKLPEYSNIKVLMYYKIVEDDTLRRAHWSYVSSSQLRRHLELLGMWGFTPVTFADYLAAARGELRLPKRPVILTFENGCQDIYKTAFPALKEFGFNAVVFALGDRTVRVDEWNRQMGLPADPLVRDEELAAMAESGFEIGSHSLTYANLPALPEEDAWREIAASKEILESILHTPVSSFSYPFGATDDRTRDMVVRAGYQFGCGLGDGVASLEEDPFHIRRVAITSSTNTLSFAVKMLTHYEQAEWISSRASEGLRDAWKGIVSSEAGAYRTTVDQQVRTHA